MFTRSAKRMTFQSVRAALTLTAYFHIACASSAQAETIVLDTFEDGSISDGVPATWTLVLPVFPGTLDAASGDLVMTPSDRAIVTSIPDLVLEDVSIRAQARLLEVSPSGSGVELLARGDRSAVTAYIAGINEDGEVYIGRANDGLPAYATANTDIRPLSEDVVLQFDVFGDKLSMWAWRAGETMPAEPLITATDNTLTTGEVGFDYYAVAATPPLGSAVYRYVHIASTHIPEPSAMAIALGCVIILLFAQRLRTKR